MTKQLLTIQNLHINLLHHVVSLINEFLVVYCSFTAPFRKASSIAALTKLK